MLIAKRTAYRSITKRTAYRGFNRDYKICRKRGKSRDWDWFICGDLLWKIFPLSGPSPKAIRIELHDTPAKDRAEISNSPMVDEIFCDGVGRHLFSAGFKWLHPHLEKHGTVYAELWY